MTALTADLTTLKTSPRAKTRTFVVKNSTTVYYNSLVALDANGVLKPHDAAAVTDRFLGVFRGFTPALYGGSEVTAGNTSASPVIRGVSLVEGAYLDGVDVTGVSDRTSIGEPVYCGDDNVASLTLTPTPFAKPVGRLVDYRSASDQDVLLFTPEEYAAYGSIVQWCIPVTLANIADGDLVTTITPGFRGRFLKWYFVVTTAVTTGSKASTLNLEVGTTNVTGGTIALASATATLVGAVIAQGSAFTAGCAFGAADTFSVEAASTTTFVEGAGVLVIVAQADE